VAPDISRVGEPEGSEGQPGIHGERAELRSCTLLGGTRHRDNLLRRKYYGLVEHLRPLLVGQQNNTIIAVDGTQRNILILVSAMRDASPAILRDWIFLNLGDVGAPVGKR
jgi:hypothetical protein